MMNKQEMEPGTQVAKMTPEAQGNVNHASVEHGIVVTFAPGSNKYYIHLWNKKGLKLVPASVLMPHRTVPGMIAMKKLQDILAGKGV